MKKLSRDEMKKVIGGMEEQAFGADVELCETKCFTSSGSNLSCIKVSGSCFIDVNCSNTSTCK